MISRQSRESAGGVLSFTFLDVLTCTMGSLVLLVVILGQKATHTRLEDALRYGPQKASPSGVAIGGPTSEASRGEPSLVPPSSAMSAAEVAAQLTKLQKQDADLTKLRAKAAER